MRDMHCKGMKLGKRKERYRETERKRDKDKDTHFVHIMR